MTPKYFHVVSVPSYDVAFTASGPPRWRSLSVSESMARYGTIVFASSYAVDLAHRERLAKGPYARDIEIGLWLSMVPEEFRPRVVPLAAELAPKVLEHLGGAGRMKLDTQNETMVVDWLVGAIVYRIEEFGGRAWLEGWVKP